MSVSMLMWSRKRKSCVLRSRIENVHVRSPFHFSGVGSWQRIYIEGAVSKVSKMLAPVNSPGMTAP